MKYVVLAAQLHEECHEARKDADKIWMDIPWTERLELSGEARSAGISPPPGVTLWKHIKS